LGRRGNARFCPFVGRRIHRTSTLFVATYRDERLPLNHPVRLALGELTGDHVIRMRLPPLSAAAVGGLAGRAHSTARTCMS